jgi:hypothetical protein
MDWKLLFGVWFAFLLNYIRIKLIDFNTGAGGVYAFFVLFGGLALLLSGIMFIGCRVSLK